jgi:hypothetical protein
MSAGIAGDLVAPSPIAPINYATAVAALGGARIHGA